MYGLSSSPPPPLLPPAIRRRSSTVDRVKGGVQRLRPRQLLPQMDLGCRVQEVVRGSKRLEKVVLGPRFEVLPHQQTVPCVATVAAQVMEASHPWKHSSTSHLTLLPPPHPPPLLPHSMRLGGAARPDSRTAHLLLSCLSPWHASSSAVQCSTDRRTLTAANFFYRGDHLPDTDTITKVKS